MRSDRAINPGTALACAVPWLTESAVGFEPTINGFANRCLTTWLHRHRIDGWSRTTYHRVCSPAPHHAALGSADKYFPCNLNRGWP